MEFRARRAATAPNATMPNPTNARSQDAPFRPVAGAPEATAGAAHVKATTVAQSVLSLMMMGPILIVVRSKKAGFAFRSAKFGPDRSFSSYRVLGCCAFASNHADEWAKD